jgi:hypothetical protein
MGGRPDSVRHAKPLRMMVRRRTQVPEGDEKVTRGNEPALPGRGEPRVGIRQGPAQAKDVGGVAKPASDYRCR